MLCIQLSVGIAFDRTYARWHMQIPDALPGEVDMVVVDEDTDPDNLDVPVKAFALYGNGKLLTGRPGPPILHTQE